MRVTIDGNPVSCDMTGVQDGGEAMAVLYRKVADSGRVVYRVEVNGREISTLEEQEMGSLGIGEVREISLTTNSPGELLRNSLEGVIELADGLRSDGNGAVEAFRTGDVQTGSSRYLACVGGMELFFRMTGAILDGIRTGYLPSAPSGTDAVDSCSRETTEILERLMEYQKREDWTAMADVLEYELDPNLRQWKQVLEGVRAN
ncbi:MAG: hypothetical protein Kow00128_00190 [Deltaproteobacteria bacterium]